MSDSDNSSNGAQEFIQEIIFDDSLEQRHYELYEKIYGGSSLKPRRMILRNREASAERLKRIILRKIQCILF